MAMDFTKLGAVGTVDKVLDTDTVLVERGGSIYRVAGNQLGGAGGFLFEMDAASTTLDNSTIINSQDVTDMVAAYQAGSNVVIKMPFSVLNDSTTGFYYFTLGSLIEGADLDPDAEGMYIVFVVLDGVMGIYFTNGNPMPTDSASTTALRLKKGAGDGES